MLKISGKLLNKTIFTTKKGKHIPKITILDTNKNYSKLFEIVDFDNLINGSVIGTDIQIPVNQKVTVKDGKVYTNYSVAGPVEVF